MIFPAATLTQPLLEAIFLDIVAHPILEADANAAFQRLHIEIRAAGIDAKAVWWGVALRRMWSACSRSCSKRLMCARGFINSLSRAKGRTRSAARVTTKTMTAILLAGSRPGIDPLAAAASVAVKALVPICGRPMIDYVARALVDHPRIGRLIVMAQQPEQIVAHPQAR